MSRNSVFVTRPVLATALVAAVLSGCVTSSFVPDDIARGIPDGAKAIKLYSASSTDALYRDVYRELVRRGFGITQENEDMGTFSTDFNDIEQGTMLQVIVFVEDSDEGSVATMRGKWGIDATMAAGISAAAGAGVGGGGAEDAEWGASGRPGAAFGQMAIIASEIPHTRIEYERE